MLARMPIWGTWDDHDFGLNSHLGNSNPEGKKSTRKAFVEYRALANHGENGAGVYTSFRVGSLEVWLLDPRWFSMTEKSPVDASLPSCFGAAQWAWILAGLKASTAKFKLLAMGEVWQDKMNKETDDMGTFPHEREALFDFIKREKISGVMLFGGDIHCSRHLCSKARVGYDLHEFVSSPIHDRIIPSLNVPHPDLVWGKPEPRAFLRIAADDTVQPATLTATFINVAGETIHEVQLTSTQLSPS
jgi:phosphodiesterase/alkaline phosphatase D-like protein